MQVPSSSPFKIFMHTDVTEVRKQLADAMNTNKFTTEIAAQCKMAVMREVMNNTGKKVMQKEINSSGLARTRTLIGNSYLKNALFDTTFNETSTRDVGQKVYLIAKSGIKIGGFAVAILRHDTKSSDKIIYLDIVCSSAGQGRALINATIWIGQSLHCDVMQLSALPHVIGYYRNKYGFVRHPNICRPEVKYSTFQRKSEPLENWQLQYAKDIGPVLYHFGKHRDSPTDGYLMSLCLRDRPLDAQLALPFFSDNVNWSARVKRSKVPKFKAQKAFAANLSTIPNFMLKAPMMAAVPMIPHANKTLKRKRSGNVFTNTVPSSPRILSHRPSKKLYIRN